MSGHSKWHSIQHKKGANDAARGKIFTRHAKLITIAARQGGDPDMNPALRVAISNAKAENMPNNNIDRAIKKGTGEDKDSAVLMELTYEGYGQSGSALLVETLTDNRNRTVTNVRVAFGKNGGNMGESGSVAWMFARKGIITLKNIPEDQIEDIEMIAIENEAEDVLHSGENIEIICDPKNVETIENALKESGVSEENINLQITQYAENKIEIDDMEIAQKIIKLITALEDDDDVSAVHCNADFSTEVMAMLEEG